MSACSTLFASSRGRTIAMRLLSHDQAASVSYLANLVRRTGLSPWGFDLKRSKVPIRDELNRMRCPVVARASSGDGSSPAEGVSVGSSGVSPPAHPPNARGTASASSSGSLVLPLRSGEYCELGRDIVTPGSDPGTSVFRRECLEHAPSLGLGSHAGITWESLG